MVRLSDVRDYLTVAEAARLLGVSRGRVGQLVGQGRLPSILFLGRRLLLAEAVREARRTRRTKPGPVPGAERGRSQGG